jgi:osmotically-inducible protein OsmY
MRSLTLAGGVLVAACVAAGCSEATEQQAREAGQQAAEAARAAGKTVESVAQDAVNNAERVSDARNAVADARQAANEVADATSAAAQTAKVKAALVADSSVKAAGINVDTDAATKTVILKGYVPSEAEKTAASRIATEKASPGYSVRNELAVRK